MKILITGGAGFIGSHIQDKLIAQNHKVAVVDNLSSGEIDRISSKSKFYRVDICSSKALEEVFLDFKPDVVFHLAAQIDVARSILFPTEDLKINTLGTLNILEACGMVGISKLVYSNTGGAFYGDVSENKLPIKEDSIASIPLSPYGISKAAAEHYIRLYAQRFNFQWISLRYSNVYGPRQEGNKETGVVAVFIQKLLNKEQPIINGNGFNTRDYVYIDDVVSANLKALDYEGSGAFNISTGKETTNIDVFKQIEYFLKTGIKPKYGPSRAGDIFRSSLSSSKAKKFLKWKSAVNFKNGVKKTIEYYE